MSRKWLPSTLALSLALTIGCKSQGSFSGDVDETQPPTETGTTDKNPPAPAPKHERVPFTWSSDTEGAHSGQMQTTLPDGESFSGQFHQITENTTAQTLDGFYGSWYGDPWGGPDWWWDGDWPYYDAPVEYIRYYTGRVVAVLDSEQGKSMRCQFRLDEPDRGMKGGGQGNCQVSNGEHITAVFAAA